MRPSIAWRRREMVDQLARHWWALAVRGALAIILGLIAILAPQTTVAALVMLFGVYMLLDGIFTCVAAARTHDRSERSRAMMIEGVLGVLVGIFALALPLSAAIG